ncbi:hypothetical protein [Bosea vestrisii]|uniref:Uncharacterized protein n=1 Tax=Bosea vestrisii TaxID=151416 RepID=A0ABW0HBM3_9HYPH
MTDLIPAAVLIDIDGEPRLLDLDIARFLQMADIHKIRTLIAANRDELELHGEVSARRAETGLQGGRPGKAYYLNEGQALVLCALSRTPIAAQIRKALIDVFKAYREGKLVHVREHRRRMPCKSECIDADYEAVRSALRTFVNQPLALIDVLAHCVARLDRIEAGA